MTGLQNIIFHIEADASAQSARIKDEAKKLAERQIEDAILEAEKIAEEDKANAEKAVEDLIKRADAECKMDLRHAVLLKKQNIIQEAVEKAKHAIKEMQTDEYFKFLNKLLQKYSLHGSGTIFMSKADIKRMPHFFEKEIKKKKLVLMENEVDGMDGFVLSYGKVEVNCTIDALMSDNREKINDMLSHVFFDTERGD